MPVLGSSAGATKGPASAPTIGSATEGNTSASVTFTAPSFSKLPITSYTVTASPGGATGTGSSSPITVSGLTNGTAYTFTVVATHANGNSPASSASNSVTPAVPLPLVSGGSLSSDATYFYRVFTSSGVLGVSGGSVTFDTLVVAGGGPGGSNINSFSPTGGGGAGGVLYTASRTYSSNQTVTVGSSGNPQGGAGGDQATNGGNSSLGALTATGGGYGAHGQGSEGPTSGGSGGGSRTATVAAGTGGQGNAGGQGVWGASGGGGGGAGGVGGNGGGSIGGNGGPGTAAYSAWGVGNIAGGGAGSAPSHPQMRMGTTGLYSNGYGGGGDACGAARCGGSGIQGVVAVRYLKTAGRN